MWPPAWTLSVSYVLSSVPKIIPLLSVRIGLTDAWPVPGDVRMSRTLIPEISRPVEEVLPPVYVVGDGGLGWDATLDLIFCFLFGILTVLLLPALLHHLFVTAHDSRSAVMAFSSRFSFWEQKGSLIRMCVACMEFPVMLTRVF